jgi:hypothetical protein
MPGIVQVPLENKPISGNGRGEPPGVGLGIVKPFESSLCKPAANIIIESKARTPPIANILFPLAGITLPSIPKMPPNMIRTRAAEPYHASIGISTESPIKEAVALYRYAETSTDIPIADKVSVHHGSARLMKASIPPTIPI